MNGDACKHEAHAVLPLTWARVYTFPVHNCAELARMQTRRSPKTQAAPAAKRMQVQMTMRCRSHDALPSSDKPGTSPYYFDSKNE